jgi:RNA methyltransferase, TrmH family
MTLITSLQNPRVKDAVRLRDRRHRQMQGRIVIDGARELSRAIAAGVNMLEVYVCPSLCLDPHAQRILAMLPACGAEILPVTEAVFAKLAFGRRGEGVLGVAEMPRPTLDQLEAKIFGGGADRGTGDRDQGDTETRKRGDTETRSDSPGTAVGGRPIAASPPLSPCLSPPSAYRPSPGENPLVAVVEGVEKPGNLGAVLRSADGAGLSAVIAAGLRTDLYNPNAIRASLGTIFTVPVCAATAAQTRAWLESHHLKIVAAQPDASILYTQLDYRRPTAMVLGSEAEGLSPTWSGDGVTAVRLPMLGIADSLNVSAAAAVLCYEARRQRSAQAGEA